MSDLLGFLLEAYDDVVGAVATKEMPRYVEPEDVVQDVALWLLEHPEVGASDPLNYLIKAAKNRVSDYMRAERGQQSNGPRLFASYEALHEAGTELGYAQDPRDWLMNEELWTAVESAIASLHVEERTVVGLYFGFISREDCPKPGDTVYRGMTIAEVSHKLGITERTVRRRKDEALKQLRPILEEYYRETYPKGVKA